MWPASAVFNLTDDEGLHNCSITPPTPTNSLTHFHWFSDMLRERQLGTLAERTLE